MFFYLLVRPLFYFLFWTWALMSLCFNIRLHTTAPTIQPLALTSYVFGHWLQLPSSGCCISRRARRAK